MAEELFVHLFPGGVADMHDNASLQRRSRVRHTASWAGAHLADVHMAAHAPAGRVPRSRDLGPQSPVECALTAVNAADICAASARLPGEVAMECVIKM